MIDKWLRRRRTLNAPPRPSLGVMRPAPPESAVSPASGAAVLPLEDPRLEVYLQQIADLPGDDRAIIVGVLRGILAEEAAYERRVLME